MAAARGWQMAAAALAGACIVGGCQLLAGLDELEPQAAGSSSSAPGAGPGGSGGAGGNGGNGGSAGACSEISCRVEAVRTEDTTVRFVAVDATHVYFGGDSIWRATPTRNSAREDVLPSLESIEGLALDNLNGLVLWTRDDAGVLRIAKGSSNDEPDLLFPAPGEKMGPVEARGGRVYWIRGPGLDSLPSETGNGVHCTDPLTGPNGADTWLGGSPRWPAAAVVVTQVGATQVAYWHRYEGIWRREGCPQPGTEGHFAIYSMDPTTVYGLATDGQALYWTHRRGAGAVYRKALNSQEGQPGEVFEGDQIFPGHLTVAAGYVYWSTSSLACNDPVGAIHRKPADGSGTAELVQSGLTCPSAFAVDPAGQLIYWADQDTIYRLPLGS